MKLETKSSSHEIDGDKLRFAREAMGLSQQELAIKLCLSQLHIAQLEDGRLSIFFSPAHKIQIAKKAGLVLDLQELEYLIPKNIQPGSAPSYSEGISQSPANGLHSNPITAHQYQAAKRKHFLIPSCISGILAISVCTLIYFEELSMQDLTKHISVKQAFTLQVRENNMPLEPTIPDPRVELANSSAQLESEPKHLLPENCQFNKSELKQYQTINPTKKDEMVYVLSKENQSICVIDSQNKVTTLHLLPGESKSVHGIAPFTLVSSDLSRFDLYFQGSKVKANQLNTRAIRLEIAENLTAYN
ncbi:helix-turn-helix domain-containing protein [Polynucleobacter arcticus]|uniref:HTH cro/C1-type domain-containing protein n=1 Tax=Polynucleobacter arcticus TaxID=1743165 RepID=A0A6M9PI55_9BURK|nr:helix-turn-helix transcriptional regulator [Polynucleobacter arcticus]QKM60099.1 hypothetical protein DN92_03060 [Polynucleobacter arcticus]